MIKYSPTASAGEDSPGVDRKRKDWVDRVWVYNAVSPGSIRHGFLNALEVRLLQVQMWILINGGFNA